MITPSSSNRKLYYWQPLPPRVLSTFISKTHEFIKFPFLALKWFVYLVFFRGLAGDKFLGRFFQGGSGLE